MLKKFISENKEYEVFIAKDNHIEVYEKNNPKEGFIFENEKQAISFINGLTDILEEVY